MPYEFQQTTENITGKKKKEGAVTFPSAHFPNHWDPEPALTSCFFDHDSDAQVFPQFPSHNLDPGNQIPHGLCAETMENLGI